LHIPSEPEIRGDETVILADHVYSYSGDLTASWQSDPAGEAEVLGSGYSKAFLKTLLPAKAKMVKRGGEGHQFWGHPDEPTAQYNHVSKRSHLPPFVNWRLEVAAPKGNLRDYFFHLIQIVDGDSAASVKLNEREGYKLARIETGGGIEVGFATVGALVATFQVDGGPAEILRPTE
jgi:hypothetical protein